MTTTQRDIEQTTATLLSCTDSLAAHANAEPELVRAEAYHVLAAFTRLALVVEALELVPVVPRGVTGKSRMVA